MSDNPFRVSADEPSWQWACGDEVTDADKSVVDAGLHGFNLGAAPLDDVAPVACVLRAPDGHVVGGAVGRRWGICCELQQLWVQPELRRQGLGLALLRRFEALARDEGCRRFYLETFSFQAPAFYRRAGYRAALVIEGLGSGISKFTMMREESDAA
jgi:GNAT superfamily N-acetyltransferase